MRLRLAPWSAWLALVLLASPAQARRFAVIVGDNAGDPGDEKLRFAEVDAQRMAAVLREVGGVAEGDAAVVLGGDATAVEQKLEAVQARLRAEARPGDQLLLYFSAHADEGELHLSGQHLALSELNDFARRAPVDVVLLIIDSCHSGAVTRLKGLRPAPATDVSLEVHPVSGRVVIGSSGPDEYAQESDTLGGSYFTAHLVAALRGAADTSRDGVVSLQEAYEYAYAHTVESTFGTRGGVQHPSYHVDLRGQGDLPLSRLESAGGRLRVELEPPGVLAVSNAETGALVGEFIKAQGPTVLALPPGAYRVRVRAEGVLGAQTVSIPMGGEGVLRSAELVAFADGLDVRKGPQLELPAPRPSAHRTVIDLGATYGGGLTRDVAGSPGVALMAAHRFARGLGPVDALALTLLARKATAAGSVAYDEQTLDARIGPAATLALGTVGLRAGPELGAIWVHQSRLPRSATRDALVPEGGGALHVEVPLAGPLAAFASGFVGVARLQSDTGTRVVPRADASVGLGLGL